MSIKIGDIFELPDNVVRIVGRRGRMKNSDETKVVGMYEVIEVEKEDKTKELKGKVIVTYGNKRGKKK